MVHRSRDRVSLQRRLETDLRVSFVQPLPDGRVLLAAARTRPDKLNGEVWSPDGTLDHRGHLGDAIKELQTTASGKVWAGYLDEGALGGVGPEKHGLARFHRDLTVDWLYPHGAGLPYISDCYTLNLHGETAHFCPYTDFHIQSASGDTVTDGGASRCSTTPDGDGTTNAWPRHLPRPGVSSWSG